MKLEELIYNSIKNIIPETSTKTIFFVSVSVTSYEVYFYSLIEGEYKQCYELAEEGLLDENELDDVFANIVDIIRKSQDFNEDKCNIVSINVEQSKLTVDFEYREKDARMYRIKKAWESKNLK